MPILTRWRVWLRLSKPISSGATRWMQAAGARLQTLASIAFGGEDLRTVYMGSLQGTRIATFRAPIAGAPPVHWDY